MMLQKNHEKQPSAELVIIEQMIPQDHLRGALTKT